MKDTKNLEIIEINNEEIIYKCRNCGTTRKKWVRSDHLKNMKSFNFQIGNYKKGPCKKCSSKAEWRDHLKKQREYKKMYGNNK